MKRRNFFGIAVTALAAFVGLKIDLRSDFDRWCDEVDRIFTEEYDIPFSYTRETGREFAWGDAYKDGCTPEDAVSEEVGYWEPC